MLRTSINICVIMSVIAAVGANSVYASSRAKNHPIRSKSSARMSLFAATPWAVYKILERENDWPRERDTILAEMRTPTPVKITLAGENAYKMYIRRRFKDYISINTKLTPPETVAENAERTFTVGFSHFVNLSSPLRDFSKSPSLS